MEPKPNPRPDLNKTAWQQLWDGSNATPDELDQVEVFKEIILEHRNLRIQLSQAVHIWRWFSRFTYSSSFHKFSSNPDQEINEILTAFDDWVDYAYKIQQ